MHSGLTILVWGATVVALQALSGLALAVGVLACALVAALVARARAIRLVRRVRFLVIAIVVFFAWFTPGEALLFDWPQLAPTREGAIFAAEHAGRLLGVVFCVAILLERLSVDRLVSGLYALLRPLEVVGVPARGLATRLLLVLHYVEAAAPRGWREWLDDAEEPELRTIRLGREPLPARDACLAALGVVALVVVLGAVR